MSYEQLKSIIPELDGNTKLDEAFDIILQYIQKKDVNTPDFRMLQTQKEKIGQLNEDVVRLKIQLGQK